jgi:predicted nucleic-acid-binding Zn-ribbon protein
MKNSKTCPKCGGTHILRVEDSVSNSSISLILSMFNAIPVARYVCTDCGFAESWVDDRHLGELKERYERENK